MRSRSSGAIPSPVSVTVTTSVVAVDRELDDDPPPSPVNFTALDSRLSITCLNRSSSASTTRRPRADLERRARCRAPQPARGP